MVLQDGRKSKRNVNRCFNYNGVGYVETNSHYEIRQSFGPSIYIGRFQDEDLDFLHELCIRAKEKGDPMGQTLAGNIKGQYDFKNIGTPAEQERFMKIMAFHVNNYLRSGLQVSNLDEMPSEEEHDVAIQLQGYPWVNFSKAGEFNPMHTHPESIISASLYIDIPKVIAEEKEKIKEHSNQPVPGDIIFTGGLIDNIWQASHINYTPKTGDCIFFPGGMHHAVYPFKSDVERITLSFNIASFGFVRKDSNKSVSYNMWVNDYDR